MEITRSRLTWTLCDIGLSLEEANLSGTCIKSYDSLLDAFSSWVTDLGIEVTGKTVQPNRGIGMTGFISHDALLHLRSNLHQRHARELQDLFFTFVRQLNLSFSPALPEGHFSYNLKVQAQACLRFASSLENTLSRWDDSSEEPSLLEKMSSLKMG